ncbi:MAG: ROK family transcriptional regulator [Halothermotrichaceae bacterium]
MKNNDIKVGNSFYIRDLNQFSIFKLIHKYGPISRKQLANNTDYSSATVTNHVKSLLESGYIIETEKGDSTGGRKPVYLTINPDKAYIFVISIEVKQIEVVMFNLKLLIETRTSFPIVGKPVEMINRAINEIENMISEYDIPQEIIIGIGVSVPGQIDRHKKSLVFAPNLGWSNIPVADIINEKVDIEVIIENEANGAVIGEKEYGYPEANSMVYVSINEGIGCGMIFNGNLYTGSSGNAGEFGHIIIDSSGPLCHCGNKGCWETLASENYIIDKVNNILKINVDMDEIYNILVKGNDDIKNVLKETGENIGTGLVNIINSLSPQYLILGGKNITKIKEYIYDEIIRIVEEEALSVSLDKTTVKFSKLNGSAVINGMAYLVYDKHFSLNQ